MLRNRPQRAGCPASRRGYRTGIPRGANAGDVERLNALNASQMNCMRTRSLNRTPSLLGLLEESLKALEAEHKFLLKGHSLQRGCHPTLE